MSRVAKMPVEIPPGIEFQIIGNVASVKGAKGKLEMQLHDEIQVEQLENFVKVSPRNVGISANALAGTTRALLNNMVTGVRTGFERKLLLVGVGYRAQAQGKVLNLTLGFSHPVQFAIPEGIVIETPSQTEILIKGMDKQKVGHVAAAIRNYRPPEPYKGKGVRYSDEVIVLKEAKKK